MANGKGVEYNKNKEVKYDGEWSNGKKEGTGKYFDKYGTYYIGQWKNDLKNGLGEVYLSNRIIIYKGNFINDKSALNCIIN